MGRITGTANLAARAMMRRLRSFARDTRGNVAMMMGLLTPILIMMTMGGIDIHRVSTVRMNLQDALDAATLAAARSPYVREDQLTEIGWSTLKANLAAYPDITAAMSDVRFTLDQDDRIIADAKIDVKTLAAHIFLPPYGQLMDSTIPVSSHSEVDRASRDLEVSLVLDVTGSMRGQRLTDLKAAANDLVDMIVQDDQALMRSRMALVPYSMAVNAGGYADAVRGGIRQQTDISNAVWATAAAKSVSALTKANPGVFTANGHGLTSGQFVYVSGMTSSTSGSGGDLATLLNGKIFRVFKVTNDTFQLETGSGASWTKVSTSSYRNYASGGQVRPCVVQTCEIVVTSNNHGLQAGEMIRLGAITGMTNLNGDTRTVSAVLDTNKFIPTSAFGPAINQTYTTAANDYVQCLQLGCQLYRFRNHSSNAWTVKAASTCVSERSGAQAHTDVAAATRRVGLAYPASDNPCLDDEITPLTTDRGLLHADINAYEAVGSTAGQIGVEWGWYMVSPTFGAIFPSESRPDAYDPRRRLKVVILMTDGEFNTPYCDGVVGGAMSGSGDARQHIACADLPNPFQFSVDTCTAMRRQNVIVYTVGFDVNQGLGGAGVDTAREVMEQCATSAGHVYLPNSGRSLKDAFAAIGRSIRQLRISK